MDGCDKDGETSHSSRREREIWKTEQRRIDYGGKAAHCKYAHRTQIESLPSLSFHRARWEWIETNTRQREKEKTGKKETERWIQKKEREKEKKVLSLYSLKFLDDTGGRIGIINYDLLQWQRLRSVDYLTVMSARYNYIYISFVMEYHSSIVTVQPRTNQDISKINFQGNWTIYNRSCNIDLVIALKEKSTNCLKHSNHRYKIIMMIPSCFSAQK